MHDVEEAGQVTEAVGRPAYQQVADDLSHRIAAGEFPVGSAIPSTASLTKDYGVSVTVVRAAVNQLRAAGVLAGQPGKGVFVRTTPDIAAERAASVEELSEQVRELRAELAQAGTGHGDDLAAEVRELRRTVELIQERLAGLYAELGKPYPGDDLAESLDSERSGRGGRRD